MGVYNFQGNAFRSGNARSPWRVYGCNPHHTGTYLITITKGCLKCIPATLGSKRTSVRHACMTCSCHAKCCSCPSVRQVQVLLGLRFSKVVIDIVTAFAVQGHSASSIVQKWQPAESCHSGNKCRDLQVRIVWFLLLGRGSVTLRTYTPVA